MPERGTSVIDTGLRGRVALVTGGNHGFGASTARALSAQGASVFVAYLRLPVEAAGVSVATEASVPGQAFYRARQAMPADWLLARIREVGGRAEAMEADLANPSSVPRGRGVRSIRHHGEHCVARGGADGLDFARNGGGDLRRVSSQARRATGGRSGRDRLPRL
jgi:NAD(P)-dependent dehydrogenase (short-subunit alcohol dehydrogenase family)